MSTYPVRKFFTVGEFSINSCFVRGIDFHLHNNYRLYWNHTQDHNLPQFCIDDDNEICMEIKGKQELLFHWKLME